MPHCLIVDDDAEIRDALASYLQGFGWQVSLAGDGVQMRAQLGHARPDVIVLDHLLPGEDGLSLLRWLRETHASLAVLMLTAMGDTASRVVGLELGADDYMPKPFEPRELVARLQALLRRSGSQRPPVDDQAMLHFAGWRFDRIARQLISPDSVSMPLSAAEFRLLSAFVQRPRRVLSREQLIDATRAPGTEVNDRSIDLAVSRLRAKLGDDAREPQIVRTVRGEGYVLDAEVRTR